MKAHSDRVRAVGTQCPGVKVKSEAQELSHGAPWGLCSGGPTLSYKDGFLENDRFQVLAAGRRRKGQVEAGDTSECCVILVRCSRSEPQR